MEYTIEYLIGFGDKFVSFLYNVMLLPINRATDIFFKGVSYSFTTFSGELCYIRIPEFNILGTVFDVLIDVFFFPSTVIGWITGTEVPFLVGVLSMMLWLPIMLGLVNLSVRLIRNIIGLS